ncbi:MAG: HEAT repeat domain-containing protein [Candidatus Marinimicrobia bacterium]|nr:HEAT repeat domain-containing protein [Candidatus Neomarinimicrobiota bacterium]
MPEKISKHLKHLSYLWVTDELSNSEKIKFERTLSKSPLLKSYVKELQSSLGLISHLEEKQPSESFLQGQRNLLRGRILSLETESIYSRFLRKIRNHLQRTEFLLFPKRPILAVVTYLFIGLIIGRYFLAPQLSQEPSTIAEIPIEKRIQSILEKEQLIATNIELKENGSNQIAFQLRAEDEFSYTGNPEDNLVKELLFYFLLNDNNPGRRLRSVKLMSEFTATDEVKMVMLSALLTDNNPGVRLRSIRSLSAFEIDKQISDVCIKVLLEDDNPAVRMEALKILTKYPEDRLYPILQVVARLDENEFIRNEAGKFLDKMGSRLKPQQIGKES